MEKRDITINGKNSIALIFRYADWQDLSLMFLGTVGAIGDGLSTNCLLLYVTHLFNSLGYGKTQLNHLNFMAVVEKVSLYILIFLFLSPYSQPPLLALWLSTVVFSLVSSS